MTAIAQVERYAGQDHPCYGAQPWQLGIETVFSPFFFDGRRVHWGLPLVTRSQAIAIAEGMAEQIGLP